MTIRDHVSGFFVDAGALLTKRTGHSATLLPDGRVLVAGGIDDLDMTLATAELFDPSNDTFTILFDTANLFQIARKVSISFLIVAVFTVLQRFPRSFSLVQMYRWRSAV